MVNSNWPEVKEDVIDTRYVNQLPENEFSSIFTDKFFEWIEDGSVKKLEQNNKVYFEIPDTRTELIRIHDKNGDYIRNFFITKWQWEVLKNEHNTKSATESVISTTTVATQQLDNDVRKNTWAQSVEWLWSSVEARADELLNRFDDFNKRPIPKRLWESHKTKERLKSVVRNDITYLKSIKRDLKRYEYTYDPEIFQRDLDELENHRKILEDVRQRIVRWDDTSNIPTILWSLRDVKRADKFENKMTKYNKKVNEILKDTTLKRLWNEDMEWFQDYLEGVWSWAIEHPAQHPFYAQHINDFAYIARVNPSLYSSITTCQNTRRATWNQYNRPWVPVCAWKPVSHCETRKWVFEKWGELFSDILVSMWIIDESDTTKKEARWKFGKIWLLWLWGFAVYKIFTTKWSERWTWIWSTAAAVLWVANKDTICQWFKDAFWKTNPTPTEIIETTNIQSRVNRPTSAETQEIVDNLISPPTTVISAIWTIKINDLLSEGIISTDSSWNFIFNYNKHKAYIESHVTDNDEKELNLQAGERLRSNPRRLHIWLAALWIKKMSELEALRNDNTSLFDYELVQQYFSNIDSPINAEISKEWFKPKDNQSRYKIMYENNWKSTISREDLARYIREWLIIPKDASLASYINSPIINLENKCMKWCENIRFDTYVELLKAVKLTEWIMTEFKDRTTARKPDPFHLWIWWFFWNIQFNDGIITDTDVLKANIFHNTLKKISPKLDNNKDTYVSYLNTLRNSNIEYVREKVNLSGYPILRAIWIDFYDANEAKQAEEWLQDIKNWNKFNQWSIDDPAFSVKWSFKNFWDRLKFTAVNGDTVVYDEDISKIFPTLMNHKDKFLDFLNNPANDMWWSAIV